MTDPVFLRKPPSTRHETFVIVGGGQAACQAACTMRESGFRGRIVLVGEEAHPPYMRPPLSKKTLAGDHEEARLFLRSRDFYEKSAIELRLGVRVSRLMPETRCIELSDGGQLAYDKLLLATGARPRALDLPGSQRPEVRYLRTLDDALGLRASLSRGVHLAIIGAGYVGLEVAATASTLGARVVVLEVDERVLKRVTTPTVSEFFAETHRARGVAIHCGVRVVGFEGVERLDRVVCDNASFGADLVLVGIGAQPNVELARDAGLACDDGIVVDERCRTSDARIFAAGDCTRHPNALLGRRVRLESVQNAVDQGAIAARNMCGEELRYSNAPWFWSHQFEFRLQSAGVLDQFDEVVERGDRASGSFALIYRRGGETIGCDAVNMPGEYLAVRRELEARLANRHSEKSGHPGRQAAA